MALDYETIETCLPEFIDVDGLSEESQKKIASMVHDMFVGTTSIDLPLNATWVIFNMLSSVTNDGSDEHEALRGVTQVCLETARDGLMEMWQARQQLVGNAEPAPTLRLVEEKDDE